MSDLSPYPVQNVDTAVFLCYGCHSEAADPDILNTNRSEERRDVNQYDIKRDASKQMILAEIFAVLQDFYKDGEELREEYDYYEAVLIEQGC